ncbi:uncharacterized protein N7506_000052 [Penicillium brevicompactum]|uniref:uncharacterized protein n=1 Tax=Penicillium brevicompactum TaxID=5074 RepID=UPI002541A489|nr:uncharacterized protein N7506_000052 [Penicillium brevicompactum]KAJ5346799.1 hypothetical protein N7506_000052 [Penicillium brevicompactum]
MELLQKYVKDEGAVGIDDLNRWPSNSLGVDFLSRTTTAGSIDSLKQHDLITKVRFCKEELIGLAWFALHSARTLCSYIPSDANFV